MFLSLSATSLTQILLALTIFFNSTCFPCFQKHTLQITNQKATFDCVKELLYMKGEGKEEQVNKNCGTRRKNNPRHRYPIKSQGEGKKVPENNVEGDDDYCN